MDSLEFNFIADMQASEREEGRRKRNENQRELWRACWGWSGPEVGKPCEVGTAIVEQADGTSLYAYMERCILIEERPDGRWLAEIAMGNVDMGKGPKPWPKDGTRVVLDVWEIWAPTRDIRAAREAEVES